jgi:membrane protease subunit (stomatin/prohibitin family)
MSALGRIPRYDVRNDGAGPYAAFYCDTCSREFRSIPDIPGTIAQDLGKQAMGGLLRKVPLFGGTLADNVTGEDPRYTYKLTAVLLESAWGQVKQHFRECPTCHQLVCLSDFDQLSGYCKECSPRSADIAEAEGQHAGAAIKGFASAFGLGEVFKQASEAAKQAVHSLARCPVDGTTAPAGTKFCPECGSAMTQPESGDTCPNCSSPTKGAKFCPECGTKIAPPKPAGVCLRCGAQNQTAKFCSECGTKLG